MAKSSVTAVLVAPARMTVSVRVPLVSLTLLVAAVKATVLPSSSRMLTRFVGMLMVASMGLLRAARKRSVTSWVLSSPMTTVKDLFVSPAAKESVLFVAV